MAARGVPAATAGRWYRDRARNGYPEKAGPIGGTGYGYQDGWAAWHDRHQRGRLELLTRLTETATPAKHGRSDTRLAVHRRRGVP